MFTLIVILFVLGYAAIAFEHPIKVNKAAPAILTGMAIWSAIMVGHAQLFPAGHGGTGHLLGELYHHVSGIASILFFLLGAMTVVELMDAHAGFQVITDRINTRDRRVLLWLVGVITFLLSAMLDNLTTAIVMAALLRKLVADRNDLWTYAGVVIIAANAGGAWSPIGDVTTIMLWIDGQVTTWNIMLKLIVPSLVCLVLPLLWVGLSMKGNFERREAHADPNVARVSKREQYTVFILGLATLLGVPVFKAITHLPPFMGIMLGLAILWIYTEFIHTRGMEDRGQYQVTAILRKVDHTGILFFLGILLAVAGLETAGHLTLLSTWLSDTLGSIYVINGAIGVLSAVVDNVPLVAAAQGMYSLQTFPPDHSFWELLAFCAGTGGSMLIIGSAAGVAVMGVLGIDFMWYLKRMSLPAAIGYFGGLAAFWLMWH